MTRDEVSPMPDTLPETAKPECFHCEGQPTPGWIETPYGCQMPCFVCNRRAMMEAPDAD